MTRRSWLVLFVALGAAFTLPACAREEASPLKELERVRSGDIDVVLLASNETLQQTKDTAVLEFRRGTALVDVGTVRVTATMPMAGMAPMIGTVDVAAGDRPGRYTLSTQLGMTGGWQMSVEWAGGTARLQATAR